MKFDVGLRKYSLEYLGKNWEGCYLAFTPITVRETVGDFADLAGIDVNDKSVVREATGKVMNLIRNHFVEGVAVSGGKKVKVKEDDLEDLPVFVLEGIVSFLSQSSVKAEGKHYGVSSSQED